MEVNVFDNADNSSSHWDRPRDRRHLRWNSDSWEELHYGNTADKLQHLQPVQQDWRKAGEQHDDFVEQQHILFLIQPIKRSLYNRVVRQLNNKRGFCGG